jgi:spore germination protein KC
MVSLDLHHLKRKVKVSLDGGRVSAKLSLSGKGIIRENNTNLNLLSPAVKESVAQEMKEKTEEEVRQVIEKVQKQYKTDIFGFGNQIGWKHPDQWKNLSENWEETFSNMDVSVEVNLTIQGVGQVGSGSKVKNKGLGL